MYVCVSVCDSMCVREREGDRPARSGDDDVAPTNFEFAQPGQVVRASNERVLQRSSLETVALAHLPRATLHSSPTCSSLQCRANTPPMAAICAASSRVGATTTAPTACVGHAERTVSADSLS